jgi:outer membrane receptor for ferrienterochelin and colicin
VIRTVPRWFALAWILMWGVTNATLSAQSIAARGHVRGIIVDARTGQPLARVRVSLQSDRERTDRDGAARDRAAKDKSARDKPDREAASIDATTGADGRFDLAVPLGPATLTVSAVGYSLARQPVNVAAEATRELTIALTEGAGAYTEHVQVQGETFPRRDPGVPSEQTLTSADLQSLKSLIADDPLRAVQAMPGVAATDDLRSEFSIRGSDFRHIGVALDGVLSPQLVHTVHGVNDNGSLAMINSDILDAVTVSAGSYPQRYGDRSGAFVDFRTREGARDRVHARVSVSAVNASGVVEGPLGDGSRGSWLVAARQSYADWIVKRIDPDVTGAFGFTDAQATFAYTLAPRHTLRFNLVAGRSEWDERTRLYYYDAIDVGLNRSGIANLSLRSELTPTWTITQRVYGVAGAYRNLNLYDQVVNRGTSRDLSYRVDASHVLSPRLVVEIGGHLQWQRAGIEDWTIFDERTQTVDRYDGGATRQSAYGLVRWEPRAWLVVSPGARVDRWSQTGQTQTSPWLQTEWRLPRKLTVSAAGGVYRQAPDLDEVFGPRGSLELRAARALQGDVGISQRFGAWRWQVTGYGRDERDDLRLPLAEPFLHLGLSIPPSALTHYENTVDMTSRGVEVALQRQGPNGLSGWIGYAYADTDAFDFNRTEDYPADVDQRHTFNAYARYRISDRSSVSGRFRAGSNTPLVGYYGPSESFFTDVGLAEQRNRLRLPAYTRLDLRVDRTLSAGRNRLTLFGEVVNVYNRRNVREVTPLLGPRGDVYRLTERMLPIIPSIGLTVEF